MKIAFLKKSVALTLLVAMSLALSACGKKEEKKEESAVAPVSVVTRSVKDSKKLEENLEFPGIISSEQEAKIIAKVGGTVKGFGAKAGDKVSANQLLATIDDAKGGIYSSVNTSQVKQGQIGVEQAETALRLAETNYSNTLTQTQKDLTQVEIAKNQAQTGQSNLDITSAETIKSAQISVEQAKLATANAKANLDKQKKILSESGSNTQTSASIAMASVIDSCKTIIDNINSIAGFDTQQYASLPYLSSLGALDVSSYSDAKSAYDAALNKYNAVKALGTAATTQNATEVIGLAESVKSMADAARKLMEDSVSSQSLPENSQTGASLSGLKTQTAAYQTQAIAMVSQANGAKQGLIGTDLSSDLSLNNLQKAYELAQTQQASAEQALKNLVAGNKTQTDNYSYGVASAQNQYESAKNRLQLQIQVAKNQVDVARLSYMNAVTALQGLYDVHQAVTPIDGVLTSKAVENGETVAAGQEIGTVSRPDKIKLQFFIDEDNIKYLKLGDKASIKDSAGKSYPAKITSLTPQADALSKRFSVEVSPDKADGNAFALGTIMTAVVTIKKTPANAGNIILPLSAIQINQNESSVFVISDGKAKKEKVSIEKVVGEAAEIKTGLKENEFIIVDGTKNVREGDAVTSQSNK